MDKREILSMLMELDKLIGEKIGKTSDIGIDTDSFLGDLKVVDIIEKVVEKDLELYSENTWEWIKTGEGKEEIIDWLLSKE